MQAKFEELESTNSQLVEALQESTAHHETLLDEHNKAGERSDSLFEEKKALNEEKEEMQRLMEEALVKLQETEAARIELQDQIKASKQRSNNLQVRKSLQDLEYLSLFSVMTEKRER